MTSVDAWQNSSILDGDLVDGVRQLKAERDVIVTGSISVARTLAAHDLVDEYRLLVFPTVVGSGQRLFADGVPPTHLRLTSVERRGAAALLCFRKEL